MSTKLLKSDSRCSHGLSDDCKLTSKTVTDDYLRGERVVIYHYDCPVHAKTGVFISVADLPKGAR